MYEDPKSKISQLEKILDAREDLVTKKVRRHELHDRDSSVKQDWDNSSFKVGTEVYNPVKEQEFKNMPEEVPEKKGFSFSYKILIGSIIFFVVAFCFVAFKFIGGGNLVSSNNIEITVKAPISVAGGEIMPFEIDIKNNNNITLSGVDLGVSFPLGARSVSDTSLPAGRYQNYIGDILPGQTIKKNLSVVLFGVENEKKEINITLEYKTAGSNSLFNKNKIFTTLINSSPVNVVVTGPKEINTNQNLNYSVEITSNSPSVVKNLLLKVDYPFGFNFINSDSKTFSGNNLWLVGDLAPGSKRIIKFSGVLNGQEGEERGFNFTLGSQSKSDTKIIDVPFTSSFSSVTIRRPFVSADVLLNGQNGAEYVATAGSKVEAIINWQNNLTYQVSDVSIVVKINGNSVNKTAVQVDGGLYRSADNSIIFDKTTNNVFANLAPGKSGTSKFTFSSFGVGTVTGSGLSNPTITLDVSVTGNRVDYVGSSQDDVLFSDSRKIKITSDPQLFAKALYYIGPFKNSGPVPPKAEQETTYTVTWTVTNPMNNISGAVVQASLPPYVKWLSEIDPGQEKINYDENTRMVTWNVGNVSAGAGTTASAKEASFKVSFLPSIDQAGQIPNIVNAATITAKDNFTLTSVSNSFGALNTKLASDPYFKTNAEVVTP